MSTRCEGSTWPSTAALFWVFGDGYLQNYGLHHADTMFSVKSLIADGGQWLAALMSR